MLKKCKITIHDISIIVNMKKILSSIKIWETLPYTSINKKWGDENYFRFDINCPLECDAKSVIEFGDIVFCQKVNVLQLDMVQHQYRTIKRLG